MMAGGIEQPGSSVGVENGHGWQHPFLVKTSHSHVAMPDDAQLRGRGDATVVFVAAAAGRAVRWYLESPRA